MFSMCICHENLETAFLRGFGWLPDQGAPPLLAPQKHCVSDPRALASSFGEVVSDTDICPRDRYTVESCTPIRESPEPMHGMYVIGFFFSSLRPLVVSFAQSEGRKANFPVRMLSVNALDKAIPFWFSLPTAPDFARPNLESLSGASIQSNPTSQLGSMSTMVRSERGDTCR